jgi:hypothetical protein
LAQKLGSAGCKNKLKFCGGGSQDRRDANCKIAPWQHHGGSLSDEGKILKAGPFEAYSGRNVRSMFILKTDSLERARPWVATDPAVKAGQLALGFLSRKAALG